MGDTPTVKIGDIQTEINHYLDSIFPTDIDGYLYSPILDRKTNEWTSNFFSWPTERDEFIQHAIKNTGTKEVYIAPALYKSKNHTAVKDNVLGTQVLWLEFDGVQQNYGEDIPTPHYMLQSSQLENHIHVYWKLNEFCTDKEKIENFNKALTYSVGADASGWDCTQVLRLPLTFNHKRRQLTGKFVYNASNPAPYSLKDFEHLEPPIDEATLESVNFDSLPDSGTRAGMERFIGKKGAELFFEPMLPVGERSSGLMALAYYAAEHRTPYLTNAEIFVLLREADDRWGKFKDRRDRSRRLWDIVLKARQKYPWKGAEIGNEFGSIVSSIDLLKRLEPIDWIVEGVLEEAGLMFLAGPPGCGKTQVSLNFALHMACSKSFLGWNFGEPKKQLFVSMEMGERPLQHFLGKMLSQFTSEELELIEENLLFNTIGYGIPLDNSRAQDQVDFWMEQGDFDGIFFDSLGQATTDDLTQEATIKTTFNFVNKLKAQHNAFVWFIHHTRKAQAENKRPNKLSDIYGSQYIAAHASAVVGLYPLGGEIEVKALKVRMEKEFNTFRIQRNSDTLGFHISGVKGMIESVNIADVEEENDNDNPDGQSFPRINID